LSNDHPIVGILGGMGPAATIELMRRIVDATPATVDSDHIHLIVDNNTKVPSRIAALQFGAPEDPGPVLADMAAGLERQGCDFLAMPCNTAHKFLPAIRDAVDIPVLDMIAATVEETKSQQTTPGPVGVLASTAARRIGLYDKALESQGFQIIHPRSQERLMAIIHDIKAVGRSEHAEGELTAIIDELTEDGAKAIVVGCTELSVLMGAIRCDPPLVDALQCLTHAILSKTRQWGA